MKIYIKIYQKLAILIKFKPLNLKIYKIIILYLKFIAEKTLILI